MAASTAKNLLTDPVARTVRFDAPLLRQLEEAAKNSLRSLNAEVNHRLRASLAGKAEQSSAA